MNHILNRRLQVGGDLQTVSYLTHAQLQMDGIVSNFVSEASDWRSLTAMAVGGFAYRLGKLGVLGVSNGFPRLARILAPSVGLFTEGTAFRGVSHGLAQLSGERVGEEFFNAQGFGRDLVNFASLKIVGHAFQGFNPVLVHASQTSAMVAGHQLAYSFGLATQPEGSFVDQIVHAEAMNLQMSFGAQLTHIATGGRLTLLERSLDLELKSREIPHTRTVEAFENSQASSSLPVFAAEPSTQTKDFWPQSLEAPQKEFVKRMQAEQSAKRSAGLLEYYQEVTGEATASVEALGEAFKIWLGEGRPELDIRKGDDSTRAQYLFIKQMEGVRNEVEITSQLLKGVPDSSGHGMPVHVEIHKSVKKIDPVGVERFFEVKDSKPNGVIFFLAGYGETVAMQEEHIAHFVESGYVVVAVDQRGHGFSGHPLGAEGFMSSPGEALGDLQLVLRAIQKNPNLNSLPLLGFGFSQGALLHTLLAQYNPDAYAGFSFVSPTHHLGRRFEFVMPDPLAAAGRTLGDYAQLGIDAKSRANPGGNLVEQNFVKFADTPARRIAQKWLNRGFAPRYFLMNDSSVFWRRAIQWSSHRGEELGSSLDIPAYITVGSKDDNIGGLRVLESSRLFFDHPIERIYTEKDHQLLLEGEGISERILVDSVAFFDGILARQSSLDSPLTRLQEVIFHPNNLAERAGVLAEKSDPLTPDLHLRYVGEFFPSREDFDLLYQELQKYLPNERKLWLSLAGFGLHVHFAKKGKDLHTTLRTTATQGREEIVAKALELLSFQRSHFWGSYTHLELKHEGSHLNEVQAVAALVETLERQLIKSGISLVIENETSGMRVSVKREGDKLEVEISNPSQAPQRFYLVPHARIGYLEKQENLEGQAYRYRPYKVYQEALLEFSRHVLGEDEVGLVTRSLESTPREMPDDYAPILRALLLEKLILRALATSTHESYSQSLIAANHWIEEAYAHLDFASLLYLKGRLGAETMDRYDAAILAVNGNLTDASKRLIPFSEMPLDLPLAAVLPQEDSLRDYFLCHGVFSRPRMLQENRLLLRDPSVVARGMFVPAFNNKMAVILSNLSLLGDGVPKDVFTRTPEALEAEDLEFRNDVVLALKYFREFVRILREGQGKAHQSFIREVSPLIQSTYTKARSAISVLPPELLREYGLENLPSFEELQGEIR